MVYFTFLVFAKTYIVGTRFEVVTIYVLVLKKKNISFFPSDNCLFTAVKIALSSWWNDIMKKEAISNAY